MWLDAEAPGAVGVLRRTRATQTTPFRISALAVDDLSGVNAA
jgi:hypothetical protein